MGSTTTNRSYRYPLSTDAPNIPSDIQNLATDVDADVQALYTQVDAATIFAYKTATEGRGSTTTLANDGPTGGSLSLANLVSGAKYLISGVIIYDGGATGSEGDFKWKFTIPTSSSGMYSYSRQNLSAGYAGAFPANWTDTNTAQTTGVSAPMSVSLQGLLICGSAGALTLQWAQNTSNATNTHVEANSYLVAQRVA